MSDEPRDHTDDATKPTALPTTTGTDRSPADSPEQIGPYRLPDKPGEGGMGEVWLAERRPCPFPRVSKTK